MQSNWRIQLRALASRIIFLSISLLCIPSAIVALFYNFAALALIPQNRLRHQIRRSTRFHPQTIAITGASSPQGLRLARAFYQTGHRVVGIDANLFGPARFSRALVRTYAVAPPRNEKEEVSFVRSMMKVIAMEKVTVWVDCDEIIPSTIKAHAKSLIQQKTDCSCLAADTDLTRKFQTRQSFLETVKELGLATVEAHRVHSRADVHNILNESRGKKYILSSTNGSVTPPKPAILPQRTLSQTYNEVSQLKVTSSDVWTLEQHMEGQPRYTISSLIVRGEVKLFTVSCRLESQGGLQLVPPTSGLNQSARVLLDDLIRQLGTSFTSHLSIDFYVAERPTKTGVAQQVLPVSGKLAADPSLVLYAGKQGSIDLTRAYLSLIEPSTTVLGSYTGLPYSESTIEAAVPRDVDIGLYSIGEDISNLTAALLQTATRKMTILSFMKLAINNLSHMVSYREALYELWDPLPAFWYALVYAPLTNSLQLQHDKSSIAEVSQKIMINGS